MSGDIDLELSGVGAWIESRIGGSVQGLDPMAPGAGARRYWRVRLADESSAVLMHAVPEDPAILPPALRRPSAELPFVTVTRLLSSHGIPVPHLLGVEQARHWLLLEDLGDVRLCDLPPEQQRERHDEAIELLAHIHAIPRGAGLPFDRAFDAEWVTFELRHVLDHAAPPKHAERLAAPLARLVAQIASLPRVLCARDYQSQNLMVDPSGALRLLDYQDALLAPPELDLAALLYDSYVEIAPQRRTELLARYEYCAGRSVVPSVFALLSVQRKLKDYARFCYLVRVKHDLRYEPAVASARAALQALLPELPPEHSELAREFGDVLAGGAEAPAGGDAA
jgi:aminoglycoside/choline kinase family phosphotransferase